MRIRLWETFMLFLLRTVSSRVLRHYVETLLYRGMLLIAVPPKASHCDFRFVFS